MYDHRAEHWFLIDGGRKFPYEVQDPRFDGLYGPAVMASPESANDVMAWRHKDWHLRTDAKFLDIGWHAAVNWTQAALRRREWRLV
jgi:hypothetical protein